MALTYAQFLCIRQNYFITKKENNKSAYMCPKQVKVLTYYIVNNQPTTSAADCTVEA